MTNAASSSTSFVSYDAECPFPIQNLPYGVFSTTANPSPRPGVAIGDLILDLDALSRSSHFASSPIPADVFQHANLDKLAAREPAEWAAFRSYLTTLLSSNSPLKDAADKDTLFVPRTASSTQMHMPVRIGDYTDFYASFEHAYNAGVLIRGKENAMQPNWRHLPVGYHGRASSVVVSGTPIRRPVGQILDKVGDTQPIWAPCRRLDYELEIGFIYGGAATKLGERLTPTEAREHIFGLVLMNDWSARDIQTWEYVPLGPFLSKNFGTTISPWIVQPAALDPFKTAKYVQEPAVLPYLQDDEGFGFDVPLTLAVRPENAKEYSRIATSNMKHSYWTYAQMIAHHSSTGAPINPSDMMGSGTLSGPGVDGNPNDDALGSLLERSRLGRQPFELNADRKDMTWLRDGDSIKIEGVVKTKDGYSIGFGECEGTVLPAVLPAA